MLNRRARRRGEQGQVLIMALAFIVFFGLVTTAVLQLADTVELQQSHSQANAISNADSEGGMLLAAQAAQEQGGCVLNTQGSVTMTTGASASYTTTACNPRATADLIADECSVCVLSTAQPAAIDGTLAVQGPIAFNGGSTATTADTVTSTIDGFGDVANPGFIGCLSPSATCQTADAYSPAVQSIQPVADPLSSAPVPGGLAQPGDGPCQPDPGSDPGDYPSDSLPSGLYCNITLTTGDWRLQSGVYTVLDSLGVSGDASLTGDGVLLDFTCQYDDPRYVDTCYDPPGDADGGVLDVSTSGNVSLTAYEAGTAQNPDNLLVYFDPLEDAVLDDLPPTSCDDNAILCVDGSGTTALDGSVYAKSGQVDLGGDTRIGSTSDSSQQGDLVVSTLDSSGDLRVDGIPPSIGYCWVYDDNVRVTTSATASTGQVVVESDCSGLKSTGIISIAYGS
jgi:Tfp pilus assembly protein PilX